MPTGIINTYPPNNALNHICYANLSNSAPFLGPDIEVDSESSKIRMPTKSKFVNAR